MSTLWEKVTRDAKLITLPEAYLRLKGVIGRPEYGISDVAEAISSDPALTTRVLRLVNSPYFGMASRIDTVIRAVNLLGTQQIHDLALATSVSHAFSGIDPATFDMTQFWKSSIYRGLAAQRLAKLRGVLDNERLFVAGLLSDLGHLILYQSIPNETLKAREISRKQQRPLVEVERETLGLDYARVGATLMRQWQLPESLIETTEYHPEPARAQKNPLETAIVHIAALLSKAKSDDRPFGEGILQPNPTAMKMAETSLASCLEIDTEVEAAVDDLLRTLAPIGKAS
ncbi:MAG: HDOD domain-containing protein [Candidatus Thiodiazotropha sp. (ex Semelilucina semeliformis)]|nr:HDOD domain-containing protein [Candidatus Thiodiazotropha sp. (ex Semelilucina semeliformis)]